MTGGVLTQPMVVGGCSSRSSSATLESSNSYSINGNNSRTTRCAGGSTRRGGSLVLENSFTCAWQDWRSSVKVLAQQVPSTVGSRKGQGQRPFLVRDDLGGQYEDSFDDVEKHLLDYFTYKAVRTVLAQLSEMNPHQYAWFYNYVVNAKPQDSKLFLQKLVKEKQELAERVMVTRLHLFNKWVKKYNHAQLHKAISDENLELLRERLMQTVKFSTNTDKDLTDDLDRP